MRESTLNGYVSFNRSTWSRLALFADLNVSGLNQDDDDEDDEEGDDAVTKDILDFSECNFHAGFRLRSLRGDPYLVLQGSKARGPAELKIRRVDLRGVDLRNVDIGDEGSAFEAGEVCVDVETRLPVTFSLLSLPAVAPPVFGSLGRDYWAV